MFAYAEFEIEELFAFAISALKSSTAIDRLLMLMMTLSSCLCLNKKSTYWWPLPLPISHKVQKKKLHTSTYLGHHNLYIFA